MCGVYINGYRNSVENLEPKSTLFYFITDGDYVHTKTKAQCSQCTLDIHCQCTLEYTDGTLSLGLHWIHSCTVYTAVYVQCIHWLTMALGLGKL